MSRLRAARPGRRPARRLDEQSSPLRERPRASSRDPRAPPCCSGPCPSPHLQSNSGCLIVWPIVTGMLRRLRRGDRLLLLKLSRSGGGRVDGALTALSWAAGHSKLWVAVAAVLSAAGGPGGRRAAARGLASVALASAFVNGPLKLVSRRSRPWPPRLVNPPSTYSLPSRQ